MAMEKLKLKNNGRSISHDKLLVAFRFVDLNANGSIDREELMDAFNGLGIYVKDQVGT